MSDEVLIPRLRRAGCAVDLRLVVVRRPSVEATRRLARASVFAVLRAGVVPVLDPSRGVFWTAAAVLARWVASAVAFVLTPVRVVRFFTPTLIGLARAAVLSRAGFLADRCRDRVSLRREVVVARL